LFRVYIIVPLSTTPPGNGGIYILLNTYTILYTYVLYYMRRSLASPPAFRRAIRVYTLSPQAFRRAIRVHILVYSSIYTTRVYTRIYLGTEELGVIVRFQARYTRTYTSIYEYIYYTRIYAYIPGNGGAWRHRPLSGALYAYIY
jgi:hypothetical protein